MDTILPQYYREYGKYINTFRSLPLNLDGLKPVERRVLLTSYLVANDKFVKSARIDGNCIAKFHPHGGVYGTTVQMVNQDFLEGQGIFGVSIGIEPMPPAAMRYTEVKLPERTKELCFKYIKHVPWISGDLDDEPQYLPTKYPLCLLGNEYTQGIGFGYRTVIPCYTISDLQMRLLWLLGKLDKEPIIRPKSDCDILSDDNTIKELLTNGKAKIEVKGRSSSINIQCKTILKSWPPGRRFEYLLSKFKKELEAQDIGYIDSSNEDVGTEIIFTVLKQRNRDKIFKSFIKKLDEVLKGSISFEIVTVDLNGDIKVSSVDEMLLNTFKMFTEVNEKMLNYEINKISDQIIELQALELIRDPLSKVISKVSSETDFNRENMGEKISEIAQVSGIPEEVVKALISKYRIQKLLTLNTDTSDLVEQKKLIEEDLNNLNEYVLNQY